MFRSILISTLTLLLTVPFSAQARELSPLVSTDWLTEHRDGGNLVVLDIRNAIDGGNRETFEQGHIPGAVYSSYTDAGWRQKEGDVPGKLPPVEDLERLIGSLGIANDTDVVIVPAGVGATDFGSAARVYWTFRVLGHDDVAILNGGHRAWVEAGNDVETGWNAPASAEFEADFRPELIADTDEVQQARDAGVQLVDNRPAAQYAGEEKHPAARAAGTIPDSVNLQQGQLVQDGTAFVVDREKLQALMDQAGVSGDGQTITFCNTGHWAATGWFTLSELAGMDNVAMYDGSMTERSQDENRPLQTASSGLGAVYNWLFD
jgi:thiosulfate/3-mercaptopyruvate sulfurtransferase